MHDLLLLLGTLFTLFLVLPSTSAAAYTSTTHECNGRFDLRQYSSVRLRWVPSPGTCFIEVYVSPDLNINLLYYNRYEQYSFSSKCLRPLLWNCPSGCAGLSYTTRTGGSPSAVHRVSDVSSLKTGYLRLLYCSSQSHFEFTIATSLPYNDNSDDKVWRILGPVLATVCIMAAVFLVCVCYAQHCYRRDPMCCANLHRRVRRLFRCESAPDASAAGSGQGGQAEGHGAAGTGGGQTVPSGFMSPEAAAQELRALQDRPPAYDDFHKYHRRASFLGPEIVGPGLPSPPPYDEALESLRGEAAVDLGTLGRPGVGERPGVDNPAFQADADRFMEPPGPEAHRVLRRVDTRPSATTVEVDLAEGSGRVTARLERRHSLCGGEAHSRASDC